MDIRLIADQIGLEETSDRGCLKPENPPPKDGAYAPGRNRARTHPASQTEAKILTSKIPNGFRLLTLIRGLQLV